jgi:hypothetical protein
MLLRADFLRLISLDEDLANFVSLIYARNFTQYKNQSRQIARQLRLLDDPSTPITDAGKFLVALGHAMLHPDQQSTEFVIHPPKHRNKTSRCTQARSDDTLATPVSLALVRIEDASTSATEISYETHVRGEAAVAADFVRCLRRACPGKSIFVATPHRIQRQAVREALSKHQGNSQTSIIDEVIEELSYLDMEEQLEQREESEIVVDTIERLQGAALASGNLR